MEQIYVWAQHHAALASIIGLALSIGLAAIPNDWVKKGAFTFSQFLRRTFGDKVEKAIEDKIDAIEQGMKGDNK